MSILKVLTAPDPILNKVAVPVDQVDDNIRKLMDDMAETMYDDRCVGLAANQVGVLKRVIVLDLGEDDDQDRPEGFYPLKIANPELSELSRDQVSATEGCMSVPHQRVSVTRSSSLKVKYLDYNNNPQEMVADGWLARAIQHETDHLNGKLLLDYVSSLKKSIMLRKLIKLKKLSA